MQIRNLMSTPPVVTAPEASLRSVAELMARAGVGAVVVVDDHRVVGVVTDRDILTRAVARHVPLDGRVDSVMSSPVATVGPDESVETAYDILRRVAFRRLPVVEADGTVAGMLCVDDLMVELARRINDMAAPLAEQILEPQQQPPAPVRV